MESSDEGEEENPEQDKWDEDEVAGFHGDWVGAGAVESVPPWRLTGRTPAIIVRDIRRRSTAHVACQSFVQSKSVSLRVSVGFAAKARVRS